VPYSIAPDEDVMWREEWTEKQTHIQKGNAVSSCRVQLLVERRLRRRTALCFGARVRSGSRVVPHARRETRNARDPTCLLFLPTLAVSRVEDSHLDNGF
jgi:hypothetical protein